MQKSDFYYDLPEELIAQTPLTDRAASRLLVMDRVTGQIEHRHFSDILRYLSTGDCLVLNDTRVLPARLFGKRTDSGTEVEFLLLSQREEGLWETMVRPGKRARLGRRFVFGDGLCTGEIVEELENGNRLVRFFYEGVFLELLDRLGQMPLPPYIKEKLEDQERYQTVYARNRGSAAAPTAGLHFTDMLLEQVRAMGVSVVFLTLHVGIGTFRPVKVEKIEQHQMHSEIYRISQQAADTINACRDAGGRVIAVGTTSCRTLETVADDSGRLRAQSGSTDIFIYPGYRFKVLDGLITNFHLPESTLVMLVSAFAGREHVLAAYREAIEQRYRFFSFGDAMLLI